MAPPPPRRPTYLRPTLQPRHGAFKAISKGPRASSNKIGYPHRYGYVPVGLEHDESLGPPSLLSRNHHGIKVVFPTFIGTSNPKPSLIGSIASMILGALAAMAQTKVKRLLAHSSIGHVGYIRTGFSCGTIEGIQSLLIGLFIYASMTIDAFAIVSALRQTRVKYIADLGALAKTNPISAITFSITMFSYAGIPPLAGCCSKFYLFFAALGCGAYFLAPVGVVTSVIGRWAAGRLPRVSQFGGPKAVLPKRMFFDTPRTWILYEPMDRDKSLLLAMTSSFITSSFPYPSPLFSVTHQMALSLYL
ncbi:hypothetical protein V2J09_006308 [Rumex salicifolius]